MRERESFVILERVSVTTSFIFIFNFQTSETGEEVEANKRVVRYEDKMNNLGQFELVVAKVSFKTVQNVLF